MTFWLYNPPEPTGQPTAPGPDLNAGYVASGANGVTRGRCGGCHACPQMWRMEVPLIEGDPYAQYYAGTVYLARMPYQYISSIGAEFGDAFTDHCSWAQSYAPPLPGANTYLGPHSGPPASPTTAGEIARGWHLTFEYDDFAGDGIGYTWSLWSPVESGSLAFDPDAQTKWICQDIFKCLGSNRFRKWNNTMTFPFPYAPEELVITPFYA